MHVHAARSTSHFSTHPTVVDHAITHIHSSKMLTPNHHLPKPRPLTEQDFEVIGLSDAGNGDVRPPGAAFRSISQPRRALNPINTHLRLSNNNSSSSINKTDSLNGSAAPSAGRDLLSARVRPSLPVTQSSPAGLADHLAPPTRSSRRKKSPTRIRDPTSRHSSPAPPSPRSVSLNISSSTSTSTENLHSSSSSSSKYKTPARRQSWQPGRKSKTVEEMEKECDDDEDDDIPEDMALWNIPLSPRAGKTVQSATGSTSPSPERLSDSPISRRNSGINGVFKLDGACETPIAAQSTVSLPSLARSDSSESSESRGRLQLRGKSWGDVMHELGEDAKDLTEALERYADESIEAQEKALQRKVQETRNLSTTPPRKERIALPPKQLSEILMDPLPMSKEKEAVLSRTRPAWLPPKAKHEEEKHLKEYQEMMRLSLESDRRRAEKEKLEAANREKQRESVYKIWNEKIIPNWNQAILEQSTRELWWAGISPKSRGTVWQRAFGNSLKVNEETYNIALERARTTENELNESEERSPQKDQFRDIKRDVERTLPGLKLFQSGSPLHQSLIDILMAYSVYRKDIGYTFGLHLIAGHLLLNLSPPDAFQALANLLNRALPLSFYLQDEPQMTGIYAAFLRAFQYKLPSLYQHIHVKLQLPPPLYLEAMFTTLFALHVPVDVVSRLWDVYAFEGDAFLIRTAVAVLTVLEGSLYGSKEEVVALLGWQSGGVSDTSGNVSEWRLGLEDEFMTKVRSAGKVEVDI